jgi:hypothetical protein
MKHAKRAIFLLASLLIFSCSVSRDAAAEGVAVGDALIVGSACTGKGQSAFIEALQEGGMDAAGAEFDRQLTTGECRMFPEPFPAIVLEAADPVYSGEYAVTSLRIADDIWTVYIRQSGIGV